MNKIQAEHVQNVQCVQMCEVRSKNPVSYWMFPEDASHLEKKQLLKCVGTQEWSVHKNMGKYPIYEGIVLFTIEDRNKILKKIHCGIQVHTRPSMVGGTMA